MPPGFNGQPPAPLPVLETVTGITLSTKVDVATDWGSIKSLIESGVPYADVAEHFKIREDTIRKRGRQENWLTPSKVEKLRAEIAARQSRIFKETGKAQDPVTIKAEIWKERAEMWKERQAQIVESALGGMADRPEIAELLINDAKSFESIVKVARTLTGEEQEESKAPQLAVNIGFLRGSKPIDVQDAIEV